MNTSVSPVTDEEGVCTHFIAVQRDITHIKNAEINLRLLNENLIKQSKDLKFSNNELAQFAYVASHDLQEPLRMITSFLGLIEKKYGNIIDEKGKKYIYFAVDGAKRMKQVMLDLLEYSRVGRSEENIEEVDLNTLIKDILLLYRQRRQETGAKITSVQLPTILTYKTLLRQVFQNLVGNSLKYNKADVPPVIQISCEDAKDHWLFSVADNGIGIAPEYFEQIFIIFKRLHHKDQYPGTGIGLAITKKIIETLGGRTWVVSAEGEGSTFYFTILKNIIL